MARILYECLDWAPPTGGIRRLYRHVEILQKHSFDAHILHHKPGFRIDWFSSTAPVSYLDKDFCFSPSDVLIIPEGHSEFMRRTVTLPCRRVVIALNWARIFRHLRPGENWVTLGITNIIAGSRYEREFIQRSMGLDSSVICSGIDSDLFRPAPIKRLMIAYMPRKNPIYYHLIATCFRSRYPEFSYIPFISIDGVPHSRVAEVLSESAIFLAHTFPEGLSRKTLEAMACGCIVVGFDGHGSRECMAHEENCYRVADGDIIGAAEYIAISIRALLDNSATDMQCKAIETAKRYSMQAEENNVIAFWNTFLNAPQENDNLEVERIHAKALTNGQPG